MRFFGLEVFGFGFGLGGFLVGGFWVGVQGFRLRLQGYPPFLKLFWVGGFWFWFWFWFRKFLGRRFFGLEVFLALVLVVV